VPRNDVALHVIASVAKQSQCHEKQDCFVADAPRNDGRSKGHCERNEAISVARKERLPRHCVPRNDGCSRSVIASEVLALSASTSSATTCRREAIPVPQKERLLRRWRSSQWRRITCHCERSEAISWYGRRDCHGTACLAM